MLVGPGDVVDVRFTKWGGRRHWKFPVTPAVWQTRDGDLLLDDEGEFAEHQVRLGYPQEIVQLARDSAEELMTAARDGREPFGAAAADWLARLESMSA